MSLNDGQLDDLSDNTLVDNVQTPSIITPDPENPLTVIPENDQLRGQATKLEEDYEQKLPSMDVTLKLVEGNNAKLMDLEDVDATLLGEGKVSQDGADTINVAAEGLFDGPISRAHYTQMPSSLNFGHAKKHMQSRIALESEQLVSNFKALVTLPIEDAKCVLADVQTNHIPHLRSTTSALNQDAVTMPEKLIGCNNLFAQFGKEFIDLSKMDLCVDLTSLMNENIGGAQFVNQQPRFVHLTRALNRLMNDKKFKAFVLGVASGVAPERCENLDSYLEFVNSPVTIRDLINFYRYTGLVDFMDDRTNVAQAMIGILERIQEKAKTLQDNPQAIREYLTEEGDSLALAAQSHVKLARFVLDMTYLNFIAQELFDFFEKQ